MAKGAPVFGFKRSTAPSGWIGCAPQGEHTDLALVQASPGAKPAVRWTAHEPWTDPTRTLNRLRRSRALHKHRRVALLQRGQYQWLTLDAPADVPRPEWAAALRWQLRDAVEYPVDTAAVDVLAVPEGTSYRATAQAIAVSASDAEMRPLVSQAVDAGLPWSAIDVAETALRNLSLLASPDGRAQALLHCQAKHATLVVSCQGELLSARQMELSLLGLADEAPERRQAAYDQLGLELQRTLDGLERAYGQVSLTRLLVTPMPGIDRLCKHLSPLIYVPVAPLDLDQALDLTDVPALRANPALLNQALLAIGAALRDA